MLYRRDHWHWLHGENENGGQGWWMTPFWHSPTTCMMCRAVSNGVAILQIMPLSIRATWGSLITIGWTEIFWMSLLPCIFLYMTVGLNKVSKATHSSTKWCSCSSGSSSWLSWTRLITTFESTSVHFSSSCFESLNELLYARMLEKCQNFYVLDQWFSTCGLRSPFLWGKVSM